MILYYIIASVIWLIFLIISKKVINQEKRLNFSTLEDLASDITLFIPCIYAFLMMWIDYYFFNRFDILTLFRPYLVVIVLTSFCQFIIDLFDDLFGKDRKE